MSVSYQCQSVKALFYLLLCSTFSLIIGNHIKGLDDSILFRINWPGQHDSLLESPDYETLEMTTINNERFQCLVPLNYGESSGDEEKYTGPNALELLMPLFKKKICTLRLEAFWTYELCHGQWIKQYHESREEATQRFQDYSLGVTNLESLEKLSRELDTALEENPNPDIPQTKLEGMNVPYFAVSYSGGTPCDLTGTPRVTRILYVCYEDGRHSVYSIKETYTCEYEVIVLSSFLCQHPSYRPHEVPQTGLPCIPLREGATKRPTSLIHIEAESLKLRTHGTLVGGDLSGGSVRIEVMEADEDAEILMDLAHAPEGGPSAEVHHQASEGRSPSFAPQPAVDQNMVEDFLKGEYCLQGGAGWWKYDFCHGKMVHQFHEAKDGSMLSIRLGEFHLQAHKDWLLEHPSKAFREGRSQVSHLYSGGDFCDATGKARQVEVRLKCKQAISPSSVALYLLEPKTCEYVLGVETPLVCPLLEAADEFGLFSLLSVKPESEASATPETGKGGSDAEERGSRGAETPSGETTPAWEGGFTPMIPPAQQEGEGDIAPPVQQEGEGVLAPPPPAEEEAHIKE